MRSPIVYFDVAYKCYFVIQATWETEPMLSLSSTQLRGSLSVF